MKKTPLQQMKDMFGGKDALVKELVAKLDKTGDESKGDLSDRLKKVSNTKLLRLAGRMKELDALGGRKGLVEAIHDATHKGKPDSDYKKGLEKKTTGCLLDMHRSLKRKQA